MKIAIHVEQIDDRGCGTVTYDYYMGIRDCLGHDPLIMSSRPKSTCPMEKFDGLNYHLYEKENDIPNIVEREKIDLFYMIKAGGKDEGTTPSNCKTAIHCIFSMTEPHGNVYAGVSEWLAKRFNQSAWVPHIINLPKTDESLRDELGIPKSAFVLGRLGGYNQFDLAIAHKALINSIDKRTDLWAIFLNTKPFVSHPRIKFLPFNPNLAYKSKFINTCDAMIHARSDGETFGLSVGEFSSLNKPVFTYDADYWWYMRAHLDMLGEKALKYKNEEELTSYLLQIDKEYVKDIDWDCYSSKFSPTNVMKQFNEIFIK
jgi:hypothetical protein